MINMDTSDVVASPCVRNCCLNEHEVCLGCFRSIDEVTNWHHASNNERLKILDKARQRRQEYSQ